MLMFPQNRVSLTGSLRKLQKGSPGPKLHSHLYQQLNHPRSQNPREKSLPISSMTHHGQLREPLETGYINRPLLKPCHLPPRLLKREQHLRVLLPLPTTLTNQGALTFQSVLEQCIVMAIQIPVETRIRIVEACWIVWEDHRDDLDPRTFSVTRFKHESTTLSVTHQTRI